MAILSSADQFETIERTISDLRSTLVQAGIPTFEANLASANLYMHRGIYRKAISEYQAALAQRPDKPAPPSAAPPATKSASTPSFNNPPKRPWKNFDS